MYQKGRVNNRKTYYIKKEFQLKFILRFCILLLVGVVISTSVLFLFSQDTLTTSFQKSKLVIENTGIAILPSVIYTNLITLGLITLASIVITLFVSHKIAGPLYRFEKEIKDIGQGDLTKKITLRGKDQITEIGDSLNNMVADLNKKVFDIHSDVENICKAAVSDNAPEKITKQLNQLRENIENNFKI